MRFVECLNRVLKHEGGFVNDPLDSGGITNLGVTKRVWEEFVGHPVSESDMRNLTVDKVSKLYKQKYWDRVSADKLPKGVDYVVFDFAVNAGTGRATKMLQSTVGSTPDGIIGNQTMARINSFDVKDLIEKYSNARTKFYQDIVVARPNQSRFINGWLRRTNEAKEYAIKDIS